MWPRAAPSITMTESGVQREHGNLSSELLPFYFLAACCKCKLDLNFWIWCIKMTSWSWHWNYGKESAYWQSKLNHRERQEWEQPGLIAQAGSLAFFICQRPQECSGGNSLDPAQQLTGSSWKLGKQRLTQPFITSQLRALHYPAASFSSSHILVIQDWMLLLASFSKINREYC